MDFRPVLAGELYGPLWDLRVFEQVRVDPEIITLVWPNGADFDPVILQDRPRRQAQLQSRAKRWEAQAA